MFLLGMSMLAVVAIINTLSCVINFKIERLGMASFLSTFYLWVGILLIVLDRYIFY